MTRGRQLSRSQTCLVKRALVVFAWRQLRVLLGDYLRLEPNDREGNQFDLGVRIFHTFLLEIPLGSLHKQAVNLDSNWWRLGDILPELLQDVGLEGQGINGDFSRTSIGLHCGSHETLREEESGKPERNGRSVVDPV